MLKQNDKSLTRWRIPESIWSKRLILQIHLKTRSPWRNGLSLKKQWSFLWMIFIIFSQACVCPQGGRVGIPACFTSQSRGGGLRGTTSPNFWGGFFFDFGFLWGHTTPPPDQTPEYGQHSAGTHPTGMHSCLWIYWIAVNSSVQWSKNKMGRYLLREVRARSHWATATATATEN